MSVFGLEYGFKDAAEHVGLSVLAFKKLHADGKGPAFRVNGRTVLFNVDKLNEWATAYREQVYAESTLSPVKGKAKGKPVAKGNGKARTAPLEAARDLLA
jgi:hypothetical protein